MVVGNLTIDDVVLPDGTTRMASVGGNSLYAALGARPWQPSIGIVTRRGDDFPGDLAGELKTLGIASAGIVAVAGPTVRNWVVYEASGDRHWIYRTSRERSREVAVQAGDLPETWLSGGLAPVVHVAAMPIDAAEAVVDAVRRKSPEALITLDTHEDYVASYRERLRALAARVEAFLPSRSELADLVGYDDPLRALGELAAELPAPIIVVKMGAEGVLVWDRRRGVLDELPAAKGEVVDVTGAGDGFCGGFAAGLSLGDTPVRAAQRGVVSAAFAVASFGSLGLASIVPAEADARLKAEPPPRRLSLPSRESPHEVPGADRGIKSPTDIMREEIAMIPGLLATQLEALAGPLRDVVRADVTNLYLVGCGDSAFAGAAAALAFRKHSGIHAEAVEAMELARYRVRYLPPASTVVCLSFSGKVGRTIEAAVQARRFGHRVVAITGDAGSPLALAADHVVALSVPTLGYSPGTSTYLAMLLALLQLATLWKGNGSQLSRVPDLARETLAAADGPVGELAERLSQRSWITFLGAGPNLSSAAFGAAKLFEGPQILGTVANLEEWAHGEYFVTGAQTPVVLVAPSGASFDRANEILSELDYLKADSALVSDALPSVRPGTLIPIAPGLPEEFSPILAVLPLSLLAYYLAKARGQASFEFPSPEAAREHYETIHRATVAEPA